MDIRFSPSFSVVVLCKHQDIHMTQCLCPTHLLEALQKCTDLLQRPVESADIEIITYNRIRVRAANLQDATFLTNHTTWLPCTNPAATLESFDVLARGIPASLCFEADTCPDKIIRGIIAENPLSIFSSSILKIEPIHEKNGIRINFLHCSNMDSVRGINLNSNNHVCKNSR